MSRKAAVARGTTDEIAMPSMSSSNEKPWKPRNSCTISACSSAVRSALVAIRQWSSRPSSHRLASGRDAVPVGLLTEQTDDGLGVADVDGQQHGETR